MLKHDSSGNFWAFEEAAQLDIASTIFNTTQRWQPDDG